MIEATITAEQLEKALAALREARERGYDKSVAVLCLVSAGRDIDECRLVTIGLLVRSGVYDFGRRTSADQCTRLQRSAAQRLADRLS